MSSPALPLPRLRRDQWEIARHPAKVKVLSMGRRWGKSVLGTCVCLPTANLGGPVAWIVPEYKNGRPLWRMAKQAVGEMQAAGLAKVNESDRLITFERSGGFLGIYSADNIDAIRGEKFCLVVLDEAARIKAEAWEDAVQPTLADLDGDAILISTPKGHNWFWQEWMRGQPGDDRVKSWKAPSSDNPNPNIQRAARLIRDRVPERVYQQEWLGEFTDDGGGVFRRVIEAATVPANQEPDKAHQYAFGVDWAKSSDWTVITVLDMSTKRVVGLERFNQIDYSLQKTRLQAAYERWHPCTIIAERNSMGEPLLEDLQRMSLPVQGFLTTNATKAGIIEGLALAFERGEIGIPNDPVLLAELQAYEMERLPGGTFRYGAPSGMHDDCVMSLALVWSSIGLEGQLVY